MSIRVSGYLSRAALGVLLAGFASVPLGCESGDSADSTDAGGGGSTGEASGGQGSEASGGQATGGALQVGGGGQGGGEAGTGFGTLRVRPLGVYHGGYFSKNTPASPPTYDPVSRRLFHGSEDRFAVDVVDITDPNVPQKVASIALAVDEGEGPISFAPNGLTLVNGLLAVTAGPADPLSGASPRVFFFNTQGVAIGEPLELPGAGRIKRTHDGKRLVITDSGSNSDDWTYDPEAHVAILELDPSGQLDFAAIRAATSETAGAIAFAPDLTIVGFSDWNSKRAELIAAGVRIVSPADLPNPTAAQAAVAAPTVAQNLNPEAITISEDDRFAYVTFQRNNAIGAIDLEQGELVKLWSPGAKDHSQEGHGLDASDKDGAINIRPWPITSLFQADGIHAFDVDGVRYLVTANEGDPFDTALFPEKQRLADLVNPSKFGYTLDASIFTEAELASNAKLGRLNLSHLETRPDENGKLTKLVTLGSRSFSIFRESDGALIWDSGDAFERITADFAPAAFNTSEDELSFDSRSDDRGPEPEHLAVGEIDGRRFVFVNFERFGGFVTYEITDPLHPQFVDYTNTRNFSVVPKSAGVCGTTRGVVAPLTCANAGDLEPEGPLFIPRADSPIDADLLLLVHEASDSVRLFELERTAE
ncbi:MAG TPA: choice-of-anchor I family protein [Polyangiaceae bacterium]|nr:choice-of-anchor I family protein [Polyangiaceae bacterium]